MMYIMSVKEPHSRRDIQQRLRYDLERMVADIRLEYSVDVSCQSFVPESIAVFLDSAPFEDAVRNAVSLGGDSNTMACIAGVLRKYIVEGEMIWAGKLP